MKSYFFAGLFTLVFLLTASVYTFNAGGENYVNVSNAFYLISPTIALIAGIYALFVFGISSSRTRSLIFVVLGIAAFFLGEVIWVIFQSILNIDPFPSFADFYYLTAYPLLLIGFSKELRAEKVVWTVMKMWIFILSFLSIVSLTGYFGIYLAYDPSVPLFESLISMSYGVGDVFLIAVLLFVLFLTMEFKGGRVFLPWLLITLSMGARLFSDLIYAAFNEEYFNQEQPFYVLADLGWVLSYLFIAFAFVQMAILIQEIQARLKKS